MNIEQVVGPETDEIKDLHEKIIGDQKEFANYLRGVVNELEGDLNMIAFQLRSVQSAETEKDLLEAQQKLLDLKNKAENMLAKTVFERNEQELMLDSIKKEVDDFKKSFPDISAN